MHKLRRHFFSGAACEAAKIGVPSTAFSGDNSEQVSFTTLTNLSSPNTFAALMYAKLTTTFTNTILSSPARPILPPNITVNVNYPASNFTHCTKIEDFKWAFTRILPGNGTKDFDPCVRGNVGTLPDETTINAIENECWNTVSAFDAVTKADVGFEDQKFVFERVKSLISCPPI
jgi:hypothetical protein